VWLRVVAWFVRECVSQYGSALRNLCLRFMCCALRNAWQNDARNLFFGDFLNYFIILVSCYQTAKIILVGNKLHARNDPKVIAALKEKKMAPVTTEQVLKKLKN
jgi:hypothetical protein